MSSNGVMIKRSWLDKHILEKVEAVSYAGHAEEGAKSLGSHLRNYVACCSF